MTQGKPVSASRTTTYHEPLPKDANNDGNLYGGSLTYLLDAVGYFPAMRHARCRLVTASMSVAFRSPVQMGEILICHASVNAVWRTSLEVGVRVVAEHQYSGEKRHVATAYMNYVAVDEQGRPRPLPPLILENDEDRRRAEAADRRAEASRALVRGKNQPEKNIG